MKTFITLYVVSIIVLLIASILINRAIRRINPAADSYMTDLRKKWLAAILVYLCPGLNTIMVPLYTWAVFQTWKLEKTLEIINETEHA